MIYQNIQVRSWWDSLFILSDRRRSLFALRNTHKNDTREGTQHADNFYAANFVARPEEAKYGNEEGRRLHYEEKYGERERLNRQSETNEAYGASDAPDEQSRVEVCGDAALQLETQDAFHVARGCDKVEKWPNKGQIEGLHLVVDQ